MSEGSQEEPRRPKAWELANSPLIIALLTVGLFGVIAKLYSDHQTDSAELEVRKTAYVELLSEYQNRASALTQADGELDRLIGEGTNFSEAERIPPTGPRRVEFDRVAARVGQRELDILRGTGSYVATAPGFARVDFLTIAARMERTAGIPDIQLGGLRLIRTLDAPPDILWVFVRAHLPMIQDFGVRRHMMYINGEIPLRRGQSLTSEQETRLGFPEVRPGDLERQMEKTRRLHAEVQNALEGK